MEEDVLSVEGATQEQKARKLRTRIGETEKACKDLASKGKKSEAITKLRQLKELKAELTALEEAHPEFLEEDPQDTHRGPSSPGNRSG